MHGNKIVIVNGPNINLLNLRDDHYPHQYSYQDLQDIVAKTYPYIEFVWFQSNHEGAIIDYLQSLIDQDILGLIINPGGYTHYAISILDALYLLKTIKVEVHMSDIFARENYRNYSITANGVDKLISGLGINSYLKGIEYIIDKRKEEDEIH